MSSSRSAISVPMIEKLVAEIEEKGNNLAIGSRFIEKQGFQSTLSDAEQNFLRAKNVISELEEQIKNLIRNQNQLQHTIQNLKDQFSEQKFQIQSIGERLRIEFQVSINDFPHILKF